MSEEPGVSGEVPATAVRFPRITVKYCTQCKWMLRAAYYAQELLSTFSTAIGEIALVPATGGIFQIEIYTLSSVEASTGSSESIQRTELWDRKTESGFPEVKKLKQLVRDIIEPGRNLGHVDGHQKKSTTPPQQQESQPASEENSKAVPTSCKPNPAAMTRNKANHDDDPGTASIAIEDQNVGLSGQQQQQSSLLKSKIVDTKTSTKAEPRIPRNTQNSTKTNYDDDVGMASIAVEDQGEDLMGCKNCD